jgi:hypothetical protein
VSLTNGGICPVQRNLPENPNGIFQFSRRQKGNCQTCERGKCHDVANQIAAGEIASKIYSTASDYDPLVKFYVDDEIDKGIENTHTIICFKAF